ncbi:hypothetical protein B0A48_12449 [Cryoendolithus antarcticus]|uniref:SPRY domain-containing protein n=1 Tax=Cryoendolithus antarcticus TaxID=1507870 RepID=A0A1V8SS51_9PEZI|nr:hypothetical protein B0A48_12449 [Cryoendolithus antarcticus]
MSEKYQPPGGSPPGYEPQRQAPTGNYGSNNPFRNGQAQQQQSMRDQPPSYQAPQGPPPQWNDQKRAGPDDGYNLPPGPPPMMHETQTGYHPPPGPPPSFAGGDYQPPPGPPPSNSSKDSEYAPPPGPPPAQKSSEPAPPPYDPWMAVPDNALLPPPPSFKQDTSPTANADYDDATRGHTWIRNNPLWQPRQHDQQTLTRISYGDVRLTTPPNTKNVSLECRRPGQTHIRTTSKCTDTIFLSDIPVYAALSDNPLMTERAKTVYFEIQVLAMGSNTPGSGDAGIAIGFVAPPYPSWRLPGWHRASLGVHGDDGRRYVDDSYGGKDFTHAFRRGDVVGIGMHYQIPHQAGGKSRCEVFYTRNGKREGSWDLHEERDRDQEEGDVTGLEGENDLLAAVGCFGGVQFEARFRKEEWKFRP